MELLTSPEADPHTMVASELYEIPPYKVTKADRTGIKSANFGIIYGMKVKALSQTIYKTDVPTDEQLQATKVLYDLYCYKRALMLRELERAKNFVADNGYINNKLTYKMIYPQIIDINDSVDRSFTFHPDKLRDDEIIPQIDWVRKHKNLGALLNACGNYPIQSWAGGILMVVYNKLCEKLEELGIQNSVTIPLQVHDEVGGYFWLSEPQKDPVMTDLDMQPVHPYLLIKIQNEAMCCKLDYLNKPMYAPLYIGIGFGTNWGQAKGDNEELPVALQRILIKEWDDGVAPTWEEIREEGLHDHFMRRIKDYMISRVHELFNDMVEKHHFVRQEMQHMLNNNMFIGKKMNELFGTNDKSGEIKIERYLELIYGKSLDEISAMGVTWEEGEPILDDTDKILDENEVQEFFFREAALHPRVTLNDETFTVDISNLFKPIAKNVLTYIYGLENKENNCHNKEIVIRDGMKLNYTKRYILGVPTNFNEVLDRILQGEKISYKFNEVLGYDVLSTLPTAVTYTEGVYLHVKEINKISPKLLERIAGVITKYVSKAVVAQVPVYVQGDTTVDTGLRLIGISSEMQDEIDKIITEEAATNAKLKVQDKPESSESVMLDAVDNNTPLTSYSWGK